MNDLSVVLLILIIMLFSVNVFRIIKNHKKDCSGCNGDCSNCKKK